MQLTSMFKKIVGFPLMIIVIAGGVFLVDRFWPWKKDEEKQESPKSETTVTLTPEKFASTKIRCEPAVIRDVQDPIIVPARIEYRRIKRVEIMAPVDAVVQKVQVKPGTAVASGTSLAILASPEVGQARADVERSESELVLANRSHEFNDALCRNLKEVLSFLRKKPRQADVEQKFNDKLLGEHRQKVLPAYSRFILAQKVLDSAEDSVRTGALSRQKSQQAESDRDVAWESFLSISEQAEFDSQQAREKASQARAYAVRQVEITRKRLATMLGQFSKSLDSDSAETSLADANDSDKARHDRTEFSVIAPFPGTVEQRLTADSQRVEAGTVLFVVANTETLEVSAEVREGDWLGVAAYLQGGEGKPLKVSVASLGKEREFTATIDYVARFVDDQKRSVPIVALIENPQHELLPGMHARVIIPAGSGEQALVVRASAVRIHDGQEFVFVEDQAQERTYHRVDVEVGVRSGDWATIASGLKAGQKVVVEGGFTLKNELLLEPEE